MLVRQRIVTTGIAASALATLALAAWLEPWRAAGEPGESHVAADRHAIDLVFAVDTTSSMTGLLDGARRTVWSIATHIHELDPEANLRVGLVAYRDLGDAYVTKDLALTRDLDAVYAELASYRAEGGGDLPEDVDAALYDAVHRMQWRPGAKKMIFLVGDAPPATRGDVPAYNVSARAAADAGITINAIRCGTAADTAAAWQTIAMLGHGEYSTIEQDGGVEQIATPYDDQLALLQSEVDATAVAYGERSVVAGYRRKMESAMGAPAPAKADRAAYYAAAGSASSAAPEDLVGQVGELGAMTIDHAKLPAAMRAMSDAELAQDLARRATAREAYRKQIAELVDKRAAYLKAHAAGAGHGFDASVKAIVDKQLAK